MNARIVGANQNAYSCLDGLVMIAVTTAAKFKRLGEISLISEGRDDSRVESVTFSLFFCTVAHVR
jgi:hypothetical protein